ncbi:hypothetical protein QC764_0067750 [Podospora pseudoanserina]|uniref:Uncharacterized protein n=1 Tax=Podospora pseudoanserina TaxID=2609844 RepID=A0ABR0IAC5_9PEZI|nr:hypothetical protein QC764_0067750 [Podospora pseudoanserina]
MSFDNRRIQGLVNGSALGSGEGGSERIVGGMVVVMVFKRGRLAVEACQLGFGRDEGLLDPFLTRKWVRLSHMVPESVEVGRGYVDDYAAVDDSDETVGIARHDHLLGFWIASSMLKVVE